MEKKMKQYKFLIIGCLCIGCLCLFGFKSYDDSPEIKTNEGYQRYQIYQRQDSRKNTFLLDTQTGKIWCFTCLPQLKGNPEIWLTMVKIDDTDNLKKYVKKIGLKEELRQP